MKEDKSKLEALRQARDEIGKAGYDHPFFREPFILVGEVYWPIGSESTKYGLNEVSGLICRHI
jgi:hypothetical protein